MGISYMNESDLKRSSYKCNEMGHLLPSFINNNGCQYYA